jgi:hypothetical protein
MLQIIGNLNFSSKSIVLELIEDINSVILGSVSEVIVVSICLSNDFNSAVV